MGSVFVVFFSFYRTRIKIMLHINIYVQHVNIFPWKFFFFPQFTCVSFLFMNMKTYFLFRLFFFFFLLALFFVLLFSFSYLEGIFLNQSIRRRSSASVFVSLEGDGGEVSMAVMRPVFFLFCFVFFPVAGGHKNKRKFLSPSSPK